MSISDAHASLRQELARQAKEKRGGTMFELITIDDQKKADNEINRMTNTQLLRALAKHED